MPVTLSVTGSNTLIIHYALNRFVLKCFQSKDGYLHTSLCLRDCLLIIYPYKEGAEKVLTMLKGTKRCELRPSYTG